MEANVGTIEVNSKVDEISPHTSILPAGEAAS